MRIKLNKMVGFRCDFMPHITVQCCFKWTWKVFSTIYCWSYHSETTSEGLDEIFQRNDLLNDDNKSTKYDRIKLELKIKAENPRNPNKNSSRLNCVDECCDCNCLATFRLIIINFSNLMAAWTPWFRSWSDHLACIGVLQFVSSANHMYLLIWISMRPQNIFCVESSYLKSYCLPKQMLMIEKTQTKQLLSSEYVVIENIISWMDYSNRKIDLSEPILSNLFFLRAMTLLQCFVIN